MALGFIAGACSLLSAPDPQSKQAALAVGPSEGTELWFQPSSGQEVGEGAVLTLKIDRISVPHARLMAATQRLGADGIPVHAHTFEDELLYVVSGNGFAIVGQDREQIPLEAGSLLYVPPEEWHGVRNAEPENRMEVLLITTPSEAGGLADFFRRASSRPGHPPLNLPEEKLLELFRKYGMRVPTQ
jgi:mannose-6-phosphate isomerase-like protein (cupin superfamily)